MAAPGAGKTLFAGLVFEALHEAGVVDRMVVFVHRTALVQQWRDRLYQQRHIDLAPGQPIEHAGQDGVIVSYQSLDSDRVLQTHRLTTELTRTLIVLDEVHHLGEALGSANPQAWARNVTALVGTIDSGLNVAGILNLSGTLWRSRKDERISTIHYTQIEDGRRLQSVVDYAITTKQLIDRGELRPIDLRRLEARVRLADYRALSFIEGDLSDLDEKQSRATMANLGGDDAWRTDFVAAVLDRLAWAYRDLGRYHAKALIVAATQEQAYAFHTEVDKQMRARHLPPLARIAVSDEPQAHRTLAEFARAERVGVLCTVDMAGEGYDCPDIVVIGYASNKLTSLYVRQVAARAMRVTERERERGHILPAQIVLPDSQPLIEAFVSYLGEYVHEPEEAEPRDEPSPREPGVVPQGPRYVLESVQLAGEIVTVPAADGNHADLDAATVELLALRLEEQHIPGLFAPRTMIAMLSMVQEVTTAEPFDTPHADVITLGSLSESFAHSRQGTRGSIVTADAISDQANLLQHQIARYAGWWKMKGPPDTPVDHFQRLINEAGGWDSRDTASIEQLVRGRDFARQYITEYCDRTGITAPKALR